MEMEFFLNQQKVEEILNKNPKFHIFSFIDMVIMIFGRQPCKKDQFTQWNRNIFARDLRHGTARHRQSIDFARIFFGAERDGIHIQMLVIFKQIDVEQ